MEGDQKFDIPLDSPLDINSNSMLVGASSPKFLDNMQQKLGSLSTNSVRFEDEGWFAGWLGHKFDFVTEGNNLFDGVTRDDMTVMKRIVDGKEMYLIRYEDVSILFNPAQSEIWTYGTGTCVRNGDNELVVNGNTNGNPSTAFTLRINPYTGDLLESSLDNQPDFNVLVSKNGYAITIDVKRDSSKNFITLRRDRTSYLDNIMLDYIISNKVSIWDDSILFNPDNNQVTAALNSGFEIVGFDIENLGRWNEVINVECRNTAVATFTNRTDTTEVWLSGKATSVKLQSNYITAGNEEIKRVENIKTIRTLYNIPDDHSPETKLGYLYSMPMWINRSIQLRNLRVDNNRILFEARGLYSFADVLDNTDLCARLVLRMNVTYNDNYKVILNSTPGIPYNQPIIENPDRDADASIYDVIYTAYQVTYFIYFNYSLNRNYDWSKKPEGITINGLNYCQPPVGSVPGANYLFIPTSTSTSAPTIDVKKLYYIQNDSFNINADLSWGDLKVLPSDFIAYNSTDMFMYFSDMSRNQVELNTNLTREELKDCAFELEYKIIGNYEENTDYDTFMETNYPLLTVFDNIDTDFSYQDFIDIKSNFSVNLSFKKGVFTEDRASLTDFLDSGNSSVTWERAQSQYNKINKTDTKTSNTASFSNYNSGLINVTGTSLLVSYPSCVPAYCAGEISFTNVNQTGCILDSMSSVMTHRTLSRQELLPYITDDDGNITPIIRLDDGAMVRDFMRSSLNNYCLNLITNDVNLIPALNNGVLQVFIDHSYSGQGILYGIIVEPTTLDDEGKTVAGIDYPLPAWFTDGNAYMSNDVAEVFMPSGTVIELNYFIRTGKQITGSTSVLDVTPNTVLNSKIFSSVSPDIVTSNPRFGVVLGNTVVDVIHTTIREPDADNRYYVVSDMFEPVEADDNGQLNIGTVFAYQKVIYRVDDNTFIELYIDLNENELLIAPVINCTGDYIIDNVIVDLPEVSFSLRYVDTKILEATLYRSLLTALGGVMTGIEIINQEDNTITLNDGKINLNKNELTDMTIGVMDKIETNDNENTVTYFVSIMDLVKASFIPAGILTKTPESLLYVSSTPSSVTFDYNGLHTVTIDLNGVGNILYSVRDIREENGEYRPIYKRNVEDVFMYIKQFWSNTVEVENYWWFDKNHVLELSNSNMTVFVKDITRPVDDWMGDRWNIEQQTSRSNWLTTSDLYYCLTNAYKTEPVFLKIQATATTITFLFARDLLNQDFDDIQWESVTVDIVNLELGNALRSDAISSFLPIVGTSIVANRKISTTVIGNTLMVGLVYSKGLQQWTVLIDINTATLIRVVNGYGCVGVNGCLTGGQFPISCVDETGFNAVVNDVNNLRDIAEVSINYNGGSFNLPTSIPNACYGNGSVVWFVFESISGICSHYNYLNGTHVPIELTLNNNISSMYQSESFTSVRITDAWPQKVSLTDLFMDEGSPFSSAKVFLDAAIGAIFVMNPTYSNMVYAQHSLGQYAYVWKNNTQEQVTDNASDTDKSLTFGKRRITISMTNNSKANSAWMMLILKGLSFFSEPAVDYFANNSQDQSAFNEKTGKKFSQFFVENVATTAGSALVSAGSSTSVKSSVSTMYSLEMFYSISDKSQCFAGPGFVQHNLTALCNAQSVTDTQAKCDRYKYFLSLAPLSLAILEQKNKLLYASYEGLLSLAQSVGSFTFGGPGIAAGFQAAAYAVYATYIVGEIGVKVVSAMAEAMGGMPAESYQQGSLKKYTLSLEAPHNYGQRSMTFLWPAFGVDVNNKYTNERVQATYLEDKQKIAMGPTTNKDLRIPVQDSTLYTLNSNKDVIDLLEGDLYSVQIQCKSAESTGLVSAPDDMAVIEGTTTFLSKEKVGFKNENIGVTNPVFPPPVIHDFIVDKQWQLAFTALGGEIISVSQDDTKLIDGAPSNIVITDDFCGIASSYIAMEIKNAYDEMYLRPWAITPQCIALNINRMNAVHRGTVYHAFDGYSNRIVNWKGDAGMDKEYLFQQYLFQINDNFKRSNIWPPSQYMGSFMGPPSVALRTYDKVANLYQATEKGVGTENDIPGEQKNLSRYSVPVHSYLLSTLPAMLRMLQPYKLHVVEGVTSLCTDIRSTQTAYKAPSSIDFNINGTPYRATDEFICSLKMQAGIVAVQDIVATQGLEFIGATTTTAYFYSQATRMYYAFSGSNSINKEDVLHRFKDLIEGKWDFVTQEVIIKALDTFDTLHVIRLNNIFTGQVYKPNLTIANRETTFKLLSMAGGITYQGPKRFAVTRFVINEHMIPNILENKDKWVKLSREDYYVERDYGWEYEDFSTIAPIDAVSGWTHNPFRLTTAMLGLSEETDCKFEWSITFAWTPIIERLFDLKEYVTVNVRGETVTEGGVKLSDVTHIYLFRECFTRVDDGGYYTFQFQSNNGIGNRERLFIWCDGIISVESLQLSIKQITSRRTQPLNTQVDLIGYTEL